MKTLAASIEELNDMVGGRTIYQAIWIYCESICSRRMHGPCSFHAFIRASGGPYQRRGAYGGRGCSNVACDNDAAGDR